jgi:hypothetical protein
MTEEKETLTEAKRPFHHANGTGTANRDWWPERFLCGQQHGAGGLCVHELRGQFLFCAMDFS